LIPGRWRVERVARQLGVRWLPCELLAGLVPCGRLERWYGITGKYDFVANPQRGIGRDGVAIYRWDAARDQITTIPRK
jgi:hypothetical protein